MIVNKKPGEEEENLKKQDLLKRRKTFISINNLDTVSNLKNEKEVENKAKTSTKNLETKEKIEKEVQKAKNKQESELKNSQKIKFIANFIVVPLIIITTALTVSNIFLWLNKPPSESQIKDKLDVLIENNQQISNNYVDLENRHNQLIKELNPILSQLSNESQPTDLEIPKPLADSDNWLGNKEARLVWIVYSDPDCYFCGKIHTNMLTLQKEFSEELSLVYRYYPAINSPGEEYASGLECINQSSENDKFWQTLDWIYQNETSPEKLFEAPNSNLNEQKYSECYNSKEIRNQVRNEIQKSKETFGTKWVGTPTSVFYDSKTNKSYIVVGALPYNNLKNKIQEILK
jgi:protein-disulfide isomerase